MKTNSGPLPVEPGLYYRYHHLDADFGPAHATSAPLHVPATLPVDLRRDLAQPRAGYSAFWSPHHLDQYLTEHGWYTAEDAEHRRIICFAGRAVGEGSDGEPLVMPTTSTPLAVLTRVEFEERLLITDDIHGRWYHHDWGSGPTGLQADTGRKTLAEITAAE